APQTGTFTLKSDGTFVYMPNAGFSGADSFVYKDYDGSQYSSNATATITVNEHAPVASNSSVAGPHDRAVVITSGVSDAESDGFTLAAASNPSHGTLTIASGTFTYTPNASFSGSDS